MAVWAPPSKIMKAVGVAFVVFICALCAAAYVTLFDDFCQEDILYKPYIKYYVGGREEALRTGKPDREGGPGLYIDFHPMDKKNVYLCINGLAWLYWSEQTDYGHVFTEPELHKFIHQCQLVNPEYGYGNITEYRLLHAVLLMGDENDYRLPSIQLFTAPFQEGTEVTKVKKNSSALGVYGEIYNATSLLMIGDRTECFLQKGNQEIRIRSQWDTKSPLESAGEESSGSTSKQKPSLESIRENGYAGSFCKVSYKHIALNTVPIGAAGPDDTVGPLLVDYVKFAMKALKNDDKIYSKGCYSRDNYTETTKDIIEQRTNQIEKLVSTAEPYPEDYLFFGADQKANDWFEENGLMKDDPNADFNPADFRPDGLKCGTVTPGAPGSPATDSGSGTPYSEPTIEPTSSSELDTYGQNGEPIIPPLTPPIEDICKKESMEEYLKYLESQLTANQDNETVLEKLKTEAEKKKTRLRMMPCQTKAFLLHLELKETYTNMKAHWDKVKTDVEPLITTELENIKKAQEEQSKKEKAMKRNPGNSTAEQEYDEAKKKVEGAVAQFELKADALAEHISIAESFRKKFEDVKKMAEREFRLLDTNFKRAKAKADPGCPYDLDGFKGSLSGTILIKRDPDYHNYLQTEDKTPGIPFPDRTKFISTNKAAADKTCALLPRPKEECRQRKPDAERLCALINAKRGIYLEPTKKKKVNTSLSRKKKRSPQDEAPEEKEESPDAGGGGAEKPASGTSPQPSNANNKEPKKPQIINWKSEDAWREEVLELVSEIFSQLAKNAVPEQFVRDVSRVMKGYLLDAIPGTLPREEELKPQHPPEEESLEDSAGASDVSTGSDNGDKGETPVAAPEEDKEKRLASFGVDDDELVWNTVRRQTPTSTIAPPNPFLHRRKRQADEAGSEKKESKEDGEKSEAKPMPLPAARRFWKHIVGALRECNDWVYPLNFAPNPNPNEKVGKLYGEGKYIYRKSLWLKNWKHVVDRQPAEYVFNWTLEYFHEQAELEYAFNWLIDMQWRIFVSVMGLCMPAYETKFQHITSKFYTYFTDDFFLPLVKEWTNNRDNLILKHIFGDVYGQELEEWVIRMMEASFVESGAIHYRPPRKLRVNSLAEYNYFIKMPQTMNLKTYFKRNWGITLKELLGNSTSTSGSRPFPTSHNNGPNNTPENPHETLNSNGPHVHKEVNMAVVLARGNLNASTPEKAEEGDAENVHRRSANGRNFEANIYISKAKTGNSENSNSKSSRNAEIDKSREISSVENKFKSNPGSMTEEDWEALRNHILKD